VKNNYNLFDKYLGLLEVDKSTPDFNLLKKVVRAHLIKIPFENISKLIFKKEGMNYIPDLSTYLNGIENYNFGGTCYTNNYYLFLLLEHLGFEIKLCGADMKYPDVHIISIVRLENLEFIVDGGYAAPFFEPLPACLTNDYIINFGLEKYIVKPKDETDRTRVEQYYEGKLQHWYTVKPEPRKIEDFDNVIRNSFSVDAVFMNAIRITRFSEKGAMILKNQYLTKTVYNESSIIKIHLDEIPSTIQENFGIPSSVIKKAIGHLKELKNIYD